MKLINNNITLDSILYGKIVFQQYEFGYRIGLDTLLVSSMITDKVNNNDTTILDLGAGVGGISLYILYKLNKVKVTSIEKTKEYYSLCLNNIKLNSFIKDRYTPLLGDIKNFPYLYGNFDIVISNPPYYEKDKVPVVNNYLKAVANVESTASLQDFLDLSYNFLKSKGTLFLIQKAERILEILNKINLNCWGNIILHPIYSYRDKPADRVILSMKKSSKVPFKITPGIIVHNKDGSYTKEVLKIIKGEV